MVVDVANAVGVAAIHASNAAALRAAALRTLRHEDAHRMSMNRMIWIRRQTKDDVDGKNHLYYRM